MPHSRSRSAPIPVEIPFPVSFLSLSGTLCLVTVPIFPVLFAFSCSWSLCRSRSRSHSSISLFPVPFQYAYSQSRCRIPVFDPSPIFLIPIPHSLSGCCFHLSCPVPIFPFRVPSYVSLPYSRSHSRSQSSFQVPVSIPRSIPGLRPHSRSLSPLTPLTGHRHDCSGPLPAPHVTEETPRAAHPPITARDRSSICITTPKGLAPPRAGCSRLRALFPASSPPALPVRAILGGKALSVPSGCSHGRSWCSQDRSRCFPRSHS